MGLLKKNFIFQDVNELKGVGNKLSRYLKNKKIEKIKDIILHLPYSETDRSKISELNQLEIGKIQTIKVIVKKLNFPRIKNQPNRIMCEDDTGKIDIIYFNSREGYLRKIFPLNETVNVDVMKRKILTRNINDFVYRTVSSKSQSLISKASFYPVKTSCNEGNPTISFRIDGDYDTPYLGYDNKILTTYVKIVLSRFPSRALATIVPFLLITLALALEFIPPPTK